MMKMRLKTLLTRTLVLVLLVPFIISQQEIVEPEISYTTFSKTSCIEKQCTTELYSKPFYVEEDTQFKRLDEAKSLKDKGIWIVQQKSDDNFHQIEIIDFNFTSVTFNFTYDHNSPNLTEYEFETEDGKIKTKFKVIETIFNITTQQFEDIETEIEIEIEEGNNLEHKVSGFPLNKKFKLGTNSTEITIVDNTTGMGDAYVLNSSASSNFGSSTQLLTQRFQFITTKNSYRTYLWFNLTPIPSTATIDSANLSIFKDGSGALTSPIEVRHVVTNYLDQTESDITWNNQMCGTDTDTMNTNCDTTAISNGITTSNIFHYYNVTNFTSTALLNSDQILVLVLGNITHVATGGTLVGQFSSKEAGNLSKVPSLIISYTETTSPFVPTCNNRTTQVCGISGCQEQTTCIQIYNYSSKFSCGVNSCVAV